MEEPPDGTAARGAVGGKTMTYAEECDAALDEDIEALRYILHDLHKGSPLFWEEEKEEVRKNVYQSEIQSR